MKNTVLTRPRAVVSKVGKIVGRNIAARRNALSLPVHIAAERCHVNFDQYMQLEKGIGVFNDAITLLKIAEGLGVTYETFFDDPETGRKIRNANVPVEVYVAIDNMRIGRSITMREICELIGCTCGTYATWKTGTSNASPLLFNNLIQILQLKASDLEKMVLDAKPKQEPLPQEEVVPVMELPQPAPEFVNTLVTGKKPERLDPFEERMLKIMRLQSRIGEYIESLEMIMNEAKQLHSELVALKGA